MTENDAEDTPGSTGRESGWQIRWRGALRDVVVVAVWVGAITFAFDVLRWPSWAYYLVTFGGIVLYSLVGEPWVTRPRS